MLWPFAMVTAIVFEVQRFSATVGRIMTSTVAPVTNSVVLSDSNVMSRGVQLDVGKQFGDGCVGWFVDLGVQLDNCAHLRCIIDSVCICLRTAAW